MPLEIPRPVLKGKNALVVDIMDVGFSCAYLATPYARRLSGATLYVGGDVNIMA